MQIPIIAGVSVKDGAFAASYPVNLEPRATQSGVSEGQLVTTRGVDARSRAVGPDRGAVVWRDRLYRASGGAIVAVSPDGTSTPLGAIGDDARPVAFDYGFDRLAIASAGALFYYDGSALSRVTDADLGTVLDVCWIAGYFVTTDGTSLVATSLSDPTSVDPLRYGSAETDPDPLVGVIRWREELYAFGRYTIQPFQNVGGTGFPFQAVSGATVPYGAVSAAAKCVVGGTLVFVGGARDAPIGIYALGGGDADRFSSPEIDAMLAGETDPSAIEIEARSFGGDDHLLVHLSGRTLGIALQTSGKAGSGAWYVLETSGGTYRPRHAVFWRGEHWIGDIHGRDIGVLDRTAGDQFGAPIEWRFASALAFNETPYLVNEVGLRGVWPAGANTVFLSMSRDGRVWSGEMARRLTGRMDEQPRWRIGARVPFIAGFHWRGHGAVAISRADMVAEALA